MKKRASRRAGAHSIAAVSQYANAGGLPRPFVQLEMTHYSEMTNPYQPPTAPLNDAGSRRGLSAEQREEKNRQRPMGVVAVVALFLLICAIDVGVLMAANDPWWIGSLLLAAVLVFAFRRIWWGGEQERVIAVWFLLFCLTLSLLGDPLSESSTVVKLFRCFELAHFAISAAYLWMLRKHQFFAPVTT